MSTAAWFQSAFSGHAYPCVAACPWERRGRGAAIGPQRRIGGSWAGDPRNRWRRSSSIGSNPIQILPLTPTRSCGEQKYGSYEQKEVQALFEKHCCFSLNSLGA